MNQTILALRPFSRPLFDALTVILEASVISAILSWVTLVVIWEATPLVPEPGGESLFALFLALWLLAALPAGVTLALTRGFPRQHGRKNSRTP